MFSLTKIASGPYGILFGLFVFYFAMIPKLSPNSLSFFGIHFSDKTMTYFMGLQLAFNTWSHSFASAAAGAIDVLRPGGTIVFVGIPLEPIPYDISKAQIKEARIEHVFRYAHIFPNCVNMLASGAIDVSPLITKTFSFEQSVEAFELASNAPTGQIKMQISFEAR